MKAESPENPAEAVTPEEAIERRALARAQEEAREARRASLRFWTKTVCGLAAAAVVVLGAGRAADAVMHLPVFDFSTLEVEGDVARVPVERVKQAVEPVIRGNFFTEDLDEVRRAAETVPWVKRAVVRRVWPDGLRIAVETYSAFAVYEDGRLVDPDGVLFSANPDERDNPSDPLPNFYGPAGQTAQIARYYREFSRALSSIGGRRLQRSRRLEPRDGFGRHSRNARGTRQGGRRHEHRGEGCRSGGGLPEGRRADGRTARLHRPAL